MHSLQAIFLLSAAAIVVATPAPDQIFGRAVGDSCTASEGKGSCRNTANCKGISYPTGLCPNDPNDVQCCVEFTCNVPAGNGYCRSKKNNGCPGGTFHPGTAAPWPCPGDDDIQCCVKDGASPPTPPPSPPATSSPAPAPPSDGQTVGQKILAKAKTAAGVPYAWAGGSCSGPTHDEPPYEYGDIGYDCSGLVCWALCQVTGRNLFAEGLRVTNVMYCASEAKLGYKKYPYTQRQAGDAVFFGGKCDCADPSEIHHVGLMMDSGDRMWNSPSDRENKVMEMSISGFGETPCPEVIRFTK